MNILKHTAIFTTVALLIDHNIMKHTASLSSHATEMATVNIM